MTQSTPTILRPYLEQNNIYDLMEHKMTRAQMTAAGYDLTNVHPNALGAIYHDPAFPNTVLAAKSKIATYVCPSTAIGQEARSPDGYGAWDYMFISVMDVEEEANQGVEQGSRPTSNARRNAMTRQGCLSCDKSWGIGSVSDGLSNTILCIEDAGRAHPSVGAFGSLSSRPAPIVADSVAWTGGSTGGRRMYAWADPDSGTNGFSGPSNALAPASRVVKINQNKTPVGGPPTCRWSQNNCGPNDEPFSFHTGGVNVAIGDGSVRFMSDSVDWRTLKAAAGSQDGVVVGDF
jgi:hypothetical protein